MPTKRKYKKRQGEVLRIELVRVRMGVIREQHHAYEKKV